MTSLSRLPKDLVKEIFDRLDEYDLTKMIAVCKSFSALVSWDMRRNLRLKACIEYGKRHWHGYMVILDNDLRRIDWNSVGDSLTYRQVREVNMVMEYSDSDDSLGVRVKDPWVRPLDMLNRRNMKAIQGSISGLDTEQHRHSRTVSIPGGAKNILKVRVCCSLKNPNSII